MDAILASPDGFGLGRPLVHVEVKAGKDPVDRDFVATMVARLAGDMSGELTGHMTGHMTGMFICPAGFDDEARQLARRAPRAVVLVDAEELTALLEEHYHAMSPESRAALPLSTLYLPLF
jgi:predicted Mrr-cat superfamily restriction endonuclease